METLRDNVIALMKENEKLKWLLTTNVADDDDVETINELVNK